MQLSHECVMFIHHARMLFFISTLVTAQENTIETTSNEPTDTSIALETTTEELNIVSTSPETASNTVSNTVSPTPAEATTNTDTVNELTTDVEIFSKFLIIMHIHREYNYTDIIKCIPAVFTNYNIIIKGMHSGNGTKGMSLCSA